MKLGYNDTINFAVAGNRIKIWGDSSETVYYSINDKTAKKLTKEALQADRESMVKVFTYIDRLMQESAEESKKEELVKIHVEI